MATPRLASFRLTGADGLPLHVDVRSAQGAGERRPAVVICHGFKGFKDWGWFPKLAERLAVAGFTAVSFNFSGSGVSEGDTFDELDRFAHHTPSNDLADLGTVVDFAEGEGSGWVGLVGHSRGGGMVVLQAGKDPRIRALVTWAGIEQFLRWPPEDIERWRREGKIDVVNTRTGQVLTILRDALEDCEKNRQQLDIVAAAHRVRAPWLIAHGTADATVPVAIAHQLAAASGSPRTELFIRNGADHGFGVKHPWAGSTPAFDELLDRTVRHFAGAL